MATIKLGDNDMLEFNPLYGVLICHQCHYAIQKSAVESHLLRHKIYRGARQQLVAEIVKLDLLEPDQVPLPSAEALPISGLPVLAGHRCAAPGCYHLTISVKGLQRHWTEQHGLKKPEASSPTLAFPAKLQTFFRGTQIRYFEVASSEEVSDDVVGGDNSEESMGETIILSTMRPPQTSMPSMGQPEMTTYGVSDLTPLEIQLEVLTYYHNFVTIIATTLPVPRSTSALCQYWRQNVASKALQNQWLMSGLLALSARHLSIFEAKADAKRIHYKRATQFYGEFSSGWKQIPSSCPESAGFEQETTLVDVGMLLDRLLHRATFEDASSDFPDLQSVFTIISNFEKCYNHLTIIDDADLLSDLIIDQEADTGNGQPPDMLLNRIDHLSGMIAERLERPQTLQEVFAVTNSVQDLVDCCYISFASNTARPCWDGAVAWSAKMSDLFRQLVLNSHPAALVVVAYWAAVLVQRAERFGSWVLKGVASLIVKRIVTYLSELGSPVLDLVEGVMNLVE